MTPSGPGWTNYSIRRSFDKNVNPACCAAFWKLVYFQAQRQHLKGSIYHCCGCLGDMWARASAVLGGTLTECGPIESFLSTGNSDIESKEGLQYARWSSLLAWGSSLLV